MGDRLLVRGGVWRLLERCSFADCDSLRLRAVREPAAARTLLVPFDRPRPLPDPRGVRAIRPRAWFHAIAALIAAATPLGGFAAAAASRISILAYQLEPALLMRRDGAARVMIADAVGLGKTIQAGLLLSELAAAGEGLRALVVVPAGLREQWIRELAGHFRLPAVAAGSAWLARAASDLPAAVNPWSLPGVYVVSCDLIKRPEVLRPLEDVAWDAVIVDEAHEAAIGTARRAAVHAVACRARRVVLLTATPHGGDAAQFSALAAIGAPAAGAPPMVMFRRLRSDVAPHAARRTRLFGVRLSPAERRMHRLLEAYTRRLCDAARARGDQRARLVAIVLRKRALSSAAALAASCARRLRLLEPPADNDDATQLLLPLGEEDPLTDAAPDAVLGGPGLDDGPRERRALEQIGEAAGRAAVDESKVKVLRRLLSRIREPAIVFTEYRDTLERLRRELSALGPDIQVLHGGLDLAERTAAQAMFNTRSPLLLATDAASQGLNLHERCRLVIHYELPWSPARLEQRAGRVDRIGQRRRVHEVLLVANDTAERLVLATLAARSMRTRSALPRSSALVETLSESQVAAAVIDGIPLPEPTPTREPAYRQPPETLRAEAVVEAARLLEIRRLWRRAAAEAGHGCHCVIATALRRARRLSPGIFLVYELSLAAADGTVAHRELAVIHDRVPVGSRRAAASELRLLVNRFFASAEPRIREWVQTRFAAQMTAMSSRWRNAAEAIAAREQAIVESLPSTATQLVQAGLFDQRAVRASSARSQVSAALRAEAARRVEALVWSADVLPSIEARAVLVVPGR